MTEDPELKVIGPPDVTVMLVPDVRERAVLAESESEDAVLLRVREDPDFISN